MKMSLLKNRLYMCRSVVIVAAICLPLLLVCANNARAQAKRIISGTVTDTKGSPLSGSSITEKGTLNGATADPEGKYQLTVGDNATLVISFSGFKTVEIPVKGETNLTTSMTQDLQ